MAVNADGGKKVISEFFDGKPVLYLCQSYMDLFKDLFVNKFYQLPYDMGAFQDAFWSSPEAFRRYLFSDPFMERNPRLSEMIIIYNLRTMYYEQSKLRKAIREHLKYIAEKSAYPETKAMVNHLFSDIDRFATGSDAIDFELTDAEGKMVKLSDYKNTFVVLQFVEGSSATVEHQFEALADLHHQWQDSVQIITITTKDQFASHSKRFAEHHYDWPLLNLGNDILLLERYEVRTFPEYFIIQPKMKIGMAPASAPDRFLEEQMRRLF
jgi:peroxiredoxin